MFFGMLYVNMFPIFANAQIYLSNSWTILWTMCTYGQLVGRFPGNNRGLGEIGTQIPVRPICWNSTKFKLRYDCYGTPIQYSWGKGIVQEMKQTVGTHWIKVRRIIISLHKFGYAELMIQLIIVSSSASSHHQSLQGNDQLYVSIVT
jgi:hypothetical protein